MNLLSQARFELLINEMQYLYLLKNKPLTPVLNLTPYLPAINRKTNKKTVNNKKYELLFYFLY